MPSMSGRSLMLMALISSAPMPGSEKIGSMMAAAPISVPRLSATSVIEA